MRCGKAFAAKYSLKQHSMTHEREAFHNFSCGLCSRSFIQRSNYIRHVNRRHNGACTCGRCRLHFESAKHYFDHQNGGACLGHEQRHKESKAAAASIKPSNRAATVIDNDAPNRFASDPGAETHTVSKLVGSSDVKSQFATSISSREETLRVQPTDLGPKKLKDSDVSRHTEPPQLVERGSPDGLALPAAQSSPSCLPEEMSGLELAHISDEEKSARLHHREENINVSIGNLTPLLDDPSGSRSDGMTHDSPRARADDVFTDGAASFFGGSDAEVRNSDCIYQCFVRALTHGGDGGYWNLNSAPSNHFVANGGAPAPLCRRSEGRDLS